MASGTPKQDSHSRLAFRLADQAHDIERLTAGLDEELLDERSVPENGP